MGLRQNLEQIEALRRLLGTTHEMTVFGGEIREARKAQGLTLEQLSNAAGIAKSYLSQIETGYASPPRDDKVRRIAQALGMDEDGLVARAHLAQLPEAVKARMARLKEVFDSTKEVILSVLAAQEEAAAGAEGPGAPGFNKDRPSRVEGSLLERTPPAPDEAEWLTERAETAVAQGKYAEAERLYARALATREKALGANHPDVARSLGCLADLYKTQDMYAKAEPLYKRALAIWERTPRPRGPQAATLLRSLGELYQTQGRYDEAEPLYLGALTILEESLGPDHPDLAESLEDLAVVYSRRGKYLEAAELSRRAGVIGRRTFAAERGGAEPSVRRRMGGGQGQGDAPLRGAADADVPPHEADEREGESAGIDLDALHRSGLLHHLAEWGAARVEAHQQRVRPIPVINKVAAGYPEEFTDLGYPVGVADEYISGPGELDDPNAFAVRIVGDSMAPKYRQGDIVILSPAAPIESSDDCFVRFAKGSGSHGCESTFKRVFFDAEDRVRLQPLNERYAPMVVKPSEIEGIFRAVARYERL